jgi:5-methylcytosine-specific restriction endonuclease McrA
VPALSDRDKERTRAHLKCCSACFGLLPLGQFWRNSGCADGHETICKECRKVQLRAYRAQNHVRVKHAQHAREFRQRHPERVRLSLQKWLDAHPQYERDRARRRYAADPERSHDATYRWMARNPGKMQAYYAARTAVLRAAGDVDREYVARLLSGQCAYCPAEATSVDHVIPVSRGGTNQNENLVGACRRCNASKSDRTPDEWYASRQEVPDARAV